MRIMRRMALLSVAVMTVAMAAGAGGTASAETAVPGEMVVYRAGEAVPESELVDLGPPSELGGVVLEGDPKISARVDYANNGITGGVFQATTGKILVHFPFTEHATVLVGTVKVTDQWGNSATLTAGDSYFIQKGSDIIWEVNGPMVQKSFYNWTATPENPSPMRVYLKDSEVPQSELVDLGPPSNLGGVVLSGDPKISARMDYVNGPAAAGVFQATKGDILVKFPFTEHATVLNGSVTITDQTGKKHKFMPGDAYLIRQNTTVLWQVGGGKVQKSFFNIVEQ